MSYRKIYYHIVFCTKDRKPCLSKQNRKALYKYIWGIIKREDCVLYQINGTSDHIHILMDVHPTQNLSHLIKVIKVKSNKFINRSNLFPSFDNWAAGYAAFTFSYREKDRLLEYVKSQEAHHKNISFIDEFVQLLEDHQVDYEEKYLP